MDEIIDRETTEIEQETDSSSNKGNLTDLFTAIVARYIWSFTYFCEKSAI